MKRMLTVGTTVLIAMAWAPSHGAKFPEEEFKMYFSPEVTQCLLEYRKSSTPIVRCYNLRASRDKNTSWLPRTKDSVKANRYDYGLYVSPPLERMTRDHLRPRQ